MNFDPKTLKHYPKSPGVYLMKGLDDSILYIGKAKNLQSRIKQYFVPKGDGREMLPFLVAKIETIDTIVVSSEKEACLLEHNLIKEHQPPYNILLKDDKSALAIKMDLTNPFPMVRFIRARAKEIADSELTKKALLFGPFAHAEAIRRTLDIIHRFFHLRQCSDEEFKKRKTPCILYQMKRCPAPCVGLCTKEEYQEEVKKVVSFLKGDRRDVIRELSLEMEQAAEKLEFERAGALLRAIRQIQDTTEEQKVATLRGLSQDVWAYALEGDKICLVTLFFRKGLLMGSKSYLFDGFIEETKEFLESCLFQYYQDQKVWPEEILVPFFDEGLSEIVKDWSKGETKFFMPKLGVKKRLIQMAEENAKAELKKSLQGKQAAEKVLLALKDTLMLQNYPFTIDCVDISHFGGSQTVGGAVRFVGGEKRKDETRLYHIRHAESGDDIGAMHEVMQRRLSKAKDEDRLPDLIMVDGGLNQLNAVDDVLKELNLVAIDLIGLAKEEGRHDRGVTQEQIFVRGSKTPLILPKTSPLLFFLQRIRDETHRTAITFQKKTRKKKVFTSPLDDILGIGPATRKKLLLFFGSAKAISEKEDAELLELSWLNSRQKAALLDWKKQKKT